MKKSDNSGRRESMPPGGEEEKKMKNSRKMKKWGCVMLALMSGFILPGIVQANSGLIDTPQIIDEENYYVGIKGASGNEVIIDRDLDAGAIGGYAESDSGDAESKNNSVAVSASTVGGDIYGGYADSAKSGNATASNNSVALNASTAEGTIYGGWASSWGGVANANSNSVTVDDSTVVSETGYGGNIYGGYADAADIANANSNSVTVNASTVKYDIYGGYADSAKSGDAESKNNSVAVSASTVGGDIYGGLTNSYGDGNAAASSNSVTVSGSTVANIYGGWADSWESGNATASGNSVTVSGRTVVEESDYGGNIYGGYAVADGGGNATASNNRVTVSGGSVVNDILGGYVYSDFGDAAYAGNNSVTVSGSTVANIYGGWADSWESGNATASGNSVTVSGSTVENIYGGLANSYGDGNAAASSNRVTVNGGTVKGTVYGGRAYSLTGAGYANNNSVTVSSGTITGSVYGGYVLGGSGFVNNNKIILSGTADVSNADLYGRNSEASGTNNNLVINGWSGTVNSLNNFDQLEVRAVAGRRNLTAGDRIFLFTVTNGVDDSFSQNPEGQKVNAQAGVALTVDGTIEKDGNTLLMDTASVRASDQTIIAVESRAASVAAVGRGAEAVTDSLDTLRGRGEGLSTFASIIGSRSRYNTGSHADVNGWNGIVGTAWTRELTSGTLSYGAFYENGGGSYDTHNTINGRTYRGDGDTVYNGGGLLLRWETNSGTYTEASLRAGMVKNEVGPSLEFAGNRYGFKTENNYYGGHVGIGRIMERDDGDAWDIYGKYFHMHHEGDTVTIAGDEFAFDSVNSDRLRVGARYLDRKNGRFTGYYGLAYEYEFSGDTGGTANHHAMYTPSLQGSTVIGEIGFRGTPGEDSPWSFEVSLRGYAGKQEGISGAVTAAYSF